MNIYLCICETLTDFFDIDEDNIDKEDLLSGYVRNENELDEIKENLEYKFEVEITFDYDNLGTLEELVKQIEETIGEDYDI